MKFTIALFSFAFTQLLSFSNAETATCIIGESFQPGHVDGLINTLRNNGYGEPNPDSVPLNAASVKRYQFGSAHVCVMNRFLFDNTHFKLSDLANVVSDTQGDCHGGAGLKGRAFRGDSGLLLAMALTTNGDCITP